MSFAGLIAVVGVFLGAPWGGDVEDASAVVMAAQVPALAAVQVGDLIEPHAEVHIGDGLIELRSGDASRLLVEGPASFVIEGPSSLSLMSGAVVVRSGSDEDFVVSTPQARITDLSTEFGVRVTLEGTEVTVIEGRVAVEPVVSSGRSAPSSLELRAGQSATFADSSHVPVVTASVGAFKTTFPECSYGLEMLELKPVAWHRFLWSAPQLNRVDPTRSSLKMATSSVLTTTGPALGHGRHNSALVLPGGERTRAASMRIEGALAEAAASEQLTISFWLRCDRLEPQAVLAGVRQAGNAIHEDFAFRVFGNGGLAASMAIRPAGELSGLETLALDGGDTYRDQMGMRSPSESLELRGYAGIEAGVWHHVVLTAQSFGMCSMYVDGALVVSEQLDRPLDLGDADLMLGVLPSNTLPRGAEAPFRGGIDELAIFDRVLSESEIRSLWDARVLSAGGTP